MKIVATSRSSERVSEANIHNWLAYSAADLEAGVHSYAQTWLVQMDAVRSGKLSGLRLLPAVVAATSRMGGGHF